MRIPKLKKDAISNFDNRYSPKKVNEYLQLIRSGKIKTPLEVYIERINDKKIPACENMKKEQQNNIRLINSKVIEYDAEAAEMACIWISNYCRLTGGDKDGELINLSLAQRAFINSIFGFFHYEQSTVIDEDGEHVLTEEIRKRLTEDVFYLVASGNGKTTMAAAISNYVINGLGLKHPSTYIVANSLSQAQLCWKEQINMIEKSSLSEYLSYVGMPKPELRMSHNSAISKPLADNPKTHEGINPNAVIFDEVHEYNKSSLVDDLKKNRVKQSQSSIPPLFIEITTSGRIRERYFDHRIRVLKKQLASPEQRDQKTRIWIYEQDNFKELEKDIKNAQKSNPQYGLTIQPKALQELLIKANEEPASRSNVLTKNFNIPTTSDDMFFSAKDLDYPKISNDRIFTIWAEYDGVLYKKKGLEKLFNEQPDLYYNELYMKDKIYQPLVHIGYDGSKGADDLSVVTYITSDKDGNLYVKQQYFMLKDAIETRTRIDKVDYRVYVDSGELKLLDGKMINEQDIIDSIENEISKNGFNVGKICIDPAYASYIIAHFEKTSSRKKYVEKFNSKYSLRNSKTTYDLGDLFRAKKVFSDSEILKIHMSNCEIKDTNGTIMLVKLNSYIGHKIDGVWSLIHALRAKELYEEEYGR